MLQTFPGVVFLCDQTELAVERGVADAILVRPMEELRMTPALRLVFWETTKACNLSCRHCRAVPQKTLGPTELNDRGRRFDLIDQIAEVAKPVLVLSGGEPLFRPDLFDIGAYGVESRLPDGAGDQRHAGRPSGSPRRSPTPASRASRSASTARVPATHDAFRGLPGSHALALRGLRNLRDEGVSVQINSTIAKHNVAELPALLDLALEIGADALHLFMLVPVGCGLEIAPTRDAAGRRIRARAALVRRAVEDLPDRPEGDLRAALLPDPRAAARERSPATATSAAPSSRRARAPRRRRPLLHGGGSTASTCRR